MKQIINRRLLVAIVFLITSRLCYPQEDMVTITDSQTGQLVPYTNIHIQPIGPNAKNIVIRADSGTFRNPVTIPSILRITCLGYTTYTDTLKPDKSKTILLQPDPLYVKEVVVTGQFIPVTKDKSIYLVNVINSQAIKDKAAANLTELLSNELDLRAFQDPILGTNLTMQGMFGQQVKILTDGIPVTGRQDGILDLTQLSLSNTDHIEMIEGPMSVVYGTNALVGVVNLISKDPDKNNNIAQINTYYESVGIYNFDGNIALKKNKHRFIFNCGRNFFGGYSGTDSARVQEWKPKRQFFGGFDYIYTAAKSKLHLGIDYFNEKLLNLGGLSIITDSILQNNKFVYILRYNATDLYQYTTRLNLKLDYTLKFSEQEQWETVAAWSYYNQTISAVETNPVNLVETPSPSNSDTTDFYDVMCRSTFNYSEKNWLSSIAGIDAVTETGTGAMLDGKKEIDEEAAFLTSTIFPKKRLNFQAGARVIHNSKYSAPLVYSLNLKYQPIPQLITRLSFGKGFRSPSLQELYLDFTADNHNVHGNDTLKAEYSYSYNLSALYTIPFEKQNITIEGSLFYNTFHNKIDYLFSESNPTWAEYYNIPEDKYITEGGKFIATFKFQPGFNISGGIYFLGRSKIGIPGQYYYSTDYSFNVNYNNPAYHFRISVFYKYFDDWYINDLSKLQDGSSYIYVQQYSHYKGYQSLNFTINRPFFRNRLDVSAGCKNIFNIINIASYSTPGVDPHTSAGNGDTPIGWGRTFFIRLTYNFVKN